MPGLHLDDEPVHKPEEEHVKPYVREELAERSMHFSMSEIQSRMQILRPDALALGYTRTMMGFLMFRPAPASIAMIGLGGGSIAKFCHRHLLRSAMTVIEINPHVIALRDAFGIPPDDARLQVIVADGAHHIAHTAARFDVLLVDAFDAHGMPAALGAQRFYDDGLDVLRPGGLIAVNLHAGHPQVGVYIDRIRRSFGEVLRVDDRDGCNSVIFAAKAGSLKRNGSGPPRRPATLAAEPWKELRGAFSRIAQALDRSAHNAEP